MVTTARPGAGPVPETPPPGAGSPPVLRILVGAYLRRLREASQLSPEEAARVIGVSLSRMSALEAGRAGFEDREVVGLLTCYGVTDEKERQVLRAVAAAAGSAGWWQEYADVVPGWFDAYVGLEEAASQIRSYQVQFVPGLLQTEDYARGAIMLRYSHPKEISRRVALRMARQAVLSKPDPPTLTMVLDEALLQRPIGGSRAMRGQLRHLVEMSQRPNVTIQVVPLTAGGHAAAGGPFSLLRFAGDDLPDVVYLEQLTSALYLDKPDVVSSYLAVMERLCAEALTPADSLEVLRAMLR